MKRKNLSPILSLKLHAIAHATEDSRKVANAIRNLFPDDYRAHIVLSKERLKGHYGNPIILFRFETKDGNLIRKFIENLASNLSRFDKKILSFDFERHVDSAGVLYLRFDKQYALKKRIKFQEEDPIKVKLKFGIPKEAIFEVCKKLDLVV